MGGQNNGSQGREGGISRLYCRPQLQVQALQPQLTACIRCMHVTKSVPRTGVPALQPTAPSAASMCPSNCITAFMPLLQCPHTVTLHSYKGSVQGEGGFAVIPGLLASPGHCHSSAA